MLNSKHWQTTLPFQDRFAIIALQPMAIIQVIAMGIAPTWGRGLKLVFWMTRRNVPPIASIVPKNLQHPPKRVCQELAEKMARYWLQKGRFLVEYGRVS